MGLVQLNLHLLMRLILEKCFHHRIQMLRLLLCLLLRLLLCLLLRLLLCLLLRLLLRRLHQTPSNRNLHLTRIWRLPLLMPRKCLHWWVV